MVCSCVRLVYMQGLKQKKNPEHELFSRVEVWLRRGGTFAGLFGKQQKTTLFEGFSMKLTKAQTTEIALFKLNNGKLNTRKLI